MNHRALLICGLCLGLFFGSVQAKERIFNRTFAVTPGGQLTVDAQGGSIAVTGSDTSQVVVQVVARGSEEVLDDMTISAEQNSAGVAVIAKHDTQGWFHWLFSGGLNLRVTVTVPRQYHLNLKTSGGSLAISQLHGNVQGATSGGSVRVEDVQGTVRTFTSGGSIQAERIGGETELRTSGGSITAKEIGGSLSAQSSGGSIVVDKVNGGLVAHTSGGIIRAGAIGGKIDADTSGGTVDVELIGVNRGIRASTSGGGVTVRVPRNTAGTIDASTSGGSISCDLPVTATEATGKKLRGVINGGGAEIYARTSGGGVRIVVRDEVER
ncbi:MAG TPA: DUF4097 family beta strand repeat-containing protein [Povalibacter sp.]